MLFLIGTLACNVTVTLPLFVTRALDGSDRQDTLLYAVFSAGAIACALVIAGRSMVSLRHRIRGTAIQGVTILLLGLAPGIPTALPAVFLLGIEGILYTTVTTSNLQIEAKAEMHGRVPALHSAAPIGTDAIGGPLLGRLSDVFGPRVLIELGGPVCLAPAVFGYLSVRRSIEPVN